MPIQASKRMSGDRIGQKRVSERSSGRLDEKGEAALGRTIEVTEERERCSRGVFVFLCSWQLFSRVFVFHSSSHLLRFYFIFFFFFPVRSLFSRASCRRQ
jgi:hypothetical protein